MIKNVKWLRSGFKNEIKKNLKIGLINKKIKIKAIITIKYKQISSIILLIIKVFVK
jgi:hypothetical protein